MIFLCFGCYMNDAARSNLVNLLVLFVYFAGRFFYTKWSFCRHNQEFTLGTCGRCFFVAGYCEASPRCNPPDVSITGLSPVTNSGWATFINAFLDPPTTSEDPECLEVSRTSRFMIGPCAT
ncbi:hypothetical protein SISNIDRAFT_299119 [Sistotremastrum niveocremeum HHB9708]|uniref:Uncharacterized protein n=1 Tax=Sistotremastrum niveocremeum HHB9708 TaxID=1314777 RepID=A0A164NEH1_9AGAM|nr:hypothetical protein SISNIDRAFT_299119 [Sistotremastrum niveocremeum HHB9708]